MVALSICLFTLVKIYGAPAEPPVSQPTPANSSTLSNGQPPVLPDLSAQTRQQLQAPLQPGPSTALPGAPEVVPDASPDAKSPDAKSPDAKSPDAKSPDAKSPGARSAQDQSSQDQSSQNPSRGSATRMPGTPVANPGRSTTSLSPAQRSNPATERNGQDPNVRGTADDPATAEHPAAAAPQGSPEPVYVRPETPEERDARMRREVADSVCDEYGVARGVCRSQVYR
jgi:hypothetical protein